MRRVVWLWLGALGCVAPGVSQTLPATGYVDVVVPDGAVPFDARDVQTVAVGGVPAYDVRDVGGDLVFTVQGGPPGEAVVEARVDGEAFALGVVTYEPPVDPLFDRVVAMGASLTQGTRDAVPTASAQLAGPAFRIAQQAGAWMPLPILTDPLPAMAPSDVGDDCRTPDTVSFIVGGLLETLDNLVDPATGLTDLSFGRVTPALEPNNVAVGNATLAFQRVGYDGRAEDVVAQMVGRLTLDPSGSDLFEPLSRTPLERVVDAEPTLVVSFDLWGNDIIYGLFGGDGVADITPLEDARAELRVQLDVLDATGAQVVLAALPDVTLLPGLTLDADARVAVQQIVADYNQMARDEAATRDWLHIAPLDDVVRDVADGLEVGGQTLSTAPLGGLLSLDGLHFTDTGYALAANAMMDTLADALGVDLPRLDLAEVLADDIRSPAALRAAGVPDACLP